MKQLLFTFPSHSTEHRTSEREDQAAGTTARHEVKQAPPDALPAHPAKRLLLSLSSLAPPLLGRSARRPWRPGACRARLSLPHVTGACFESLSERLGGGQDKRTAMLQASSLCTP